jgi:hypothetical protein
VGFPIRESTIFKEDDKEKTKRQAAGKRRQRG